MSDTISVFRLCQKLSIQSSEKKKKQANEVTKGLKGASGPQKCFHSFCGPEVCFFLVLIAFHRSVFIGSFSAMVPSMEILSMRGTI